MLKLFIFLALINLSSLQAQTWQWTEPYNDKESGSSQNLLVKLRLKKKIEVNSEKIYLEDVAFCSGDEEKCAEATGIVVAKSPDQNTTLILTPDKIRTLLEQEWPYTHVEIENEGILQVKSIFFQKSKDDIEAFIKEKLAEASSEEYRLDLTSLQLLSKLSTHDDSCDLESDDLVSLLKNPEDFFLLPQNRVQRLKITCSSKSLSEKETATITIRLDLKKQILIAKKSLEAGTLIDSDDFALQWRKVSNQEGIFSPTQIENKTLKAKISAGGSISPRMIYTPNTIERGQEISLLIKSGSLNVKTKAKSMQAGHLGDFIEIKQVTNNKILRAKILDDQTVVVGDDE